MKNRMLSLLSGLWLTILIPAIAPAQSRDVYTYKPESQALYDTIVHMDSVYFDAYNKCDMATQTALYADSIEFYHDKGGLETNKQALLDAIRKNICGKVTRVLVRSPKHPPNRISLSSSGDIEITGGRSHA